jgi:putative flippase GtrA
MITSSARTLLDRLTAIRFVRFAVAGGVATLVQYCVLALLVEGADVAPLAATIAAYGCGALTSYLLNRQFTFSETTTSFGDGLIRFLAVTLVGLALNTAIFAVLQTVGLHYLLAQAGATAVVLGWNYLGARFFVFR